MTGPRASQTVAIQYQLWLEAIALATDTALGDFKGRVERRGVTRSAN